MAEKKPAIADVEITREGLKKFFVEERERFQKHALERLKTALEKILAQPIESDVASHRKRTFKVLMAVSTFLISVSRDAGNVIDACDRYGARDDVVA